MEARITFRVEMYIKGDTLEEIKNNFENIPIFSADALEDAGAQFIEYVSVEDADTHEDLMSKW